MLNKDGDNMTRVTSKVSLVSYIIEFGWNATGYDKLGDMFYYVKINQHKIKTMIEIVKNCQKLHSMT